MTEPTYIVNARIENYDLKLDERRFTVLYIKNSIGNDQKIESLDESVILGELFSNKYETPRLGNDSVPEGVTKGHSTKIETIREVTREWSAQQDYTQISQWREIPADLERLLDNLPDHVKDLLKTEYSDPNVTPYDFDFPVDDF